MERKAFNYLQDWLASPTRKPLVLRGARQVGKTWLVRHFAKLCGRELIELNFEKQLAHTSLFNSNDPKQILLNINAALNLNIDPANCLLFLDEIQAAPQLFSKLRWFAEDMPELPVIAAGSLLESVLAEHAFSVPVGRINYMHLEPLSFEEFLLANHKKALFDYLSAYNFNIEIPLAIHEQLILLFKEYLLIGGMPAAVSSWIEQHNLNKVNQIHHDLLATYRDDFVKYHGRIAIERLNEMMLAVPQMLGEKFVFSRVNATVQTNILKQVLNLLEKARICHRVQCCSANGIPLAAEIREKYFKEIFLDVGLCSAMLGISFTQMNNANNIMMINNGSLAEQVVGQLLRTIAPFYIEPALYYWQREQTGSNAEVDYIIQHGNQVIPIEVKAGSTGGLKSLHLFMGLKNLPLAMRINADLPSKTAVKVKDHQGNQIEYNLLSIPFYLTEQLQRLLNGAILM